MSPGWSFALVTLVRHWVSAGNVAVAARHLGQLAWLFVDAQRDVGAFPQWSGICLQYSQMVLEGMNEDIACLVPFIREVWIQMIPNSIGRMQSVMHYEI